MTTATRTTSDFCWINVTTPQSEQARAFFTRLLGWSFVQLPGHSHTMRLGEREFGSLFDLGISGAPPGTRPHIDVVLRVGSTESSRKTVEALGGKASPAFDLMDQGPMAVCIDPTGAEFDLWEPRQEPNADVDCSMHGAPSWFELTTSDLDSAASFYCGLFGWTAELLPVPGSRSAIFKIGPARVAGLLQLSPQAAPEPAHWSTFFTVKDIEVSAREAVKLGAKVHSPILEVPGIGRLCGITSPQGVPFQLITR